jgi:hypothetical protein
MLAGMALGRIALGTASRVAPGRTARSLGVTSGPELDYMTEIFGARAVALGAGYLSTRGDARRRWQRLALAVDLSDTLAGLARLRRGDGPLGAVLALSLLTGGYATVGALKLARDAGATSEPLGGL